MVHAKKKSHLFLQQLEYHVFLGQEQAERKKKQMVHIDIHIQFAMPPKACKTDLLNDTFCYDTLNQRIKKNITNKKFHLIEHLAYDIYSSVKDFFPRKNKISVCVTKYPDIFFKSNGISFSFGDIEW